MLINALTHALALDIGFFIDLTLNNFYFLFGFALAAVYFFPGKRFVSGFLVLLAVTWSFGDFITGSGWIVTPLFFFLFITTRFIWIYTTEKHLSPGLFGLLTSFQFIVLFVIFNLFMV